MAGEPLFKTSAGPGGNVVKKPSEARGAFGYQFVTVDLSVLIPKTNPRKIQFVGDLFAIHNVTGIAPDSSFDVWVRLDGKGDWIRALPTFVWEQPFKTLELYSGTVYAGQLVEIVLQANGKLAVD